MRYVLSLLLAAAVARSEVYSVELKERTDLAAGKSWGPAGPYERITATVQFRLDPAAPQNKAIRDLDLAPRNADGKVEFSADLLVLRPRNPKQGNGTALVDIPNRGRMLANSMFNRGGSALDPQTVEELGDGFLMANGFSVVSIGWQWDTPPVPGRLGLKAPQLPASITGLVRSEFVPDTFATGFSLGDRDQTPYPIADEKDPSTRLTVSDGPGLPRTEVPRNKWHFANGTRVELEGGCKPGKIYEVVYKGTGAVPTGLGFAAVRDIASFLKYGGGHSFLLGDQRQSTKRTIAFGVSQTGRFLRHMMYEGFNVDEKNRKALDGVWSHVGGAGRGGFNHRFAQPSRDGQALLHYSWTVDMFPFADVSLKDPLTGREDGLLTHVPLGEAAPRMFETNDSYEYWGRAASLIHTTPDGLKDVEPAATTRIYFLAGGQHGPGTLPLERKTTKNLADPLDYRWAMRALLLDLDSWLKDGVEPPASRYPKVSASQLVKSASIHYPNGLKAPRPRTPHVLDFGPEFVSKGMVTKEPPAEGAAYTVLVPQVDKDGNETSGVRLPELSVPLGMYTGWNLRSAALGGTEYMSAFVGSFVPLPSAEIAARYSNKQTWLDRIRAAATSMASERLVVPADVDGIVTSAGRLWDAVSAGAK